jgi:uncharacterized protein YgiM (DUF1202 family)
MKITCWLLLGTMFSASLLAQTNAPVSSPAPTPAAGAAETNNAPSAPAAKPKTKPKAAAKKSAASELKTVPLEPGPAVVDANHVNVRGQAKLKSEVVTRLNKGQQVTVLAEIIRNNSGPSEPSAWAKIALPPEVHVWVNRSFIDPANKTVKPRKLNLRSGPGENYSILGLLHRGDSINEVASKGEWIQIDAPTNTYAFIASQFLKQEAPAASALAETPATPASVTEPPTLAEAPVGTPPTAPAEATSTTTAPTETPAPMAAPTEEPPQKRIVQREGVVRGTFSIQAPTHFELISTENGRTIDYLYTSSANLDLRRYKGLRIIVTGEEALEERWGNTPVITIQKIQVLEDFSPANF